MPVTESESARPRRPRRMAPLPDTAMCLNPGCDQQCRYDPSMRGQKPYFCSSRCRNEYHQTRDRLIRRIDILTAYMEHGLTEPFSTEADRTRTEVAQAKWLLMRYGGPE